MAYAEVEELAAALRIAATTANADGLQACLDAAGYEIDSALDRADDSAPLPPDGEALVNRVNILRGVEWWKANDAAFGVIGTAETGALTAPRNTFARHASVLTPLTERWGVA